MISNNKVSEIIWKIKIFFAVINTILFEFGLFYEGEKDLEIYIGGVIVFPLVILMWNKSLYNSLKREKFFIMSYYTFEKITLIAPIGLFIAIVGLIFRQ